MNFRTIFPGLAGLVLQACIVGGGTGGEGLTGVLVDAGGSPVAGATVGAYGLAGGTRTTSTDDQGRFRISGLKAGTYNVAGSLRAGDSTHAVFIPAVDVAGDVDLGTRSLKPAGALRIKVTAYEGEPLAGARCGVDASPYEAVSDSGGTCALDDMAPGKYRVAVSRASADTVYTDSVEVESGVVSGGTTIVILSGPDLGESWVKRNAVTRADLHAVIWTGTRYAAVGDSGTVVFSEDGAIWTAVRVGDWRARLRGIAWTGSLYVAVGAGNLDSGVVFTSPTGEVWTRRSGTTWGLNDVVWTGEGLVAVGDEGGIWTSPDGLAWDSAFSGTSIRLSSLAWSGQMLVAVGSGLFVGGSGSIMLSSPDGRTWTQRTTQAGSIFTFVTWNGRRFYAGAGGVVTSLDGITWSSPSLGGSPVLDGAWSGVGLVMTGYYSSNNAGGIWTLEPSGSTVNRYATTQSYLYLNAIVARPYLQLVVVGDEGTILTSH